MLLLSLLLAAVRVGEACVGDVGDVGEVDDVVDVSAAVRALLLSLLLKSLLSNVPAWWSGTWKHTDWHGEVLEW